MRYEATFELEPAAYFGVPDENFQTIVPGTVKNASSHPIMAGPMRQSGWGTLSRYRDDEKAIRLT